MFISSVKIFFKKIIVILLRSEAQLVLKKYRPKIVAVTGSVGKTSTKDAIYTVLASGFFVRKSSKSFNSEIGVPLTILGLQNGWNNPFSWAKNLFDGLALILFPHKYPQWLVIEVGADRPGDIRSIASWLRPDIAVVTRLGEVPVHVEFFDSAEQVRQEKSQLVLAVSAKGTVILNADDKLVSTMRPLARGRVMTYGSVHPADISGSDFNFVYSKEPPFSPTGVSFRVDWGHKISAGKNFLVEINGALGRQQMYTSLAALAVGEATGIPTEKSVKALRVHHSPPGRMRILPGLNGVCIIDDSYNSSPVATDEAIDALRKIDHHRKIVVLGDMLELGSYSRSAHEKLGIKVAGVADVIYTVGTRARGILDAAMAAGFPKDKVFGFSDSISAGEVLRQNIRSGDVVLVKGSQGVRMEKTVAMILAEPEKAEELLVRQEDEWKSR